MGAFFPSDSHPVVYFSIWEMHGFPHQFPIVQENATKLIVWGEPGKYVLILFQYYRRFLSIRFPFYGVLHHMGNACVCSLISHAKPIEWGKSGKLLPGNILQNPLHVENLVNWCSYFSHSMDAFFPLDSHPMVYFIKCEIHGFPHQFPIAWENVVKSIKLEEPRKLVPISP